MANQACILEMNNISKAFGGVNAISNVDFYLNSGEVHCLLGLNGAGKSTLMKILCGAYRKDSGMISLEGTKIEILNPIHAKKLGISIIHQKLDLVDTLNIYENIFLGNEKRNCMGVFDREWMVEEASRILASLDFEINVNTPLEELSRSQKQKVAIAKALSIQSKIFVLDEPTSPLTENEIESLFVIIKSLKQSGVGIIYISHRLDEVFEIGDRATILRNGTVIDTVVLSEIDKPKLITMMAGETAQVTRKNVASTYQEKVLEVEGLNLNTKLHNVTFHLNKGEVLGLAGLVGSGRTELVRCLFGADSATSGLIKINGRPIKIKSPSDAIKNGIVMVSEDRKADGLVMCRPIHENISVTMLKAFTQWGLIRSQLLRKKLDELSKRLQIKFANLEQRVDTLSGGNQQKVVLAKWLGLDAQIIIFDEPTSGIDIKTKQEIYQLIFTLVKQGKSIIFISSELEEVILVSDRILILTEGRIVNELPGGDWTVSQLLRHCLPDSSAQSTGKGAAI